MIPDIKELNFPEYATLSQATATLNDMGESIITTQIKIDGEVTPDFSYNWEIEFQGERYIHPLRSPQAIKDNTSVCSKVDLTFQHWLVYELKRHYFVQLAPINAGTAVPDKYIASLGLNVEDFIIAFQDVLDYYYKGAIKVQLNPNVEYSKDRVFFNISYSYIWDVLQEFYKIFGLRWFIEKDTIKIGYPANEISHVFEYGYSKGLISVERQVQDANIRNSLLGRGGSQNLPKYYFKNAPEGSLYASDPDAIPELENIFFTELRSKVFRDYVQGWKTNPNRDTKDGTIEIEPYDEERALIDYAYRRGHEDKSFDPIEYVKDDASIEKYGVLPGGLQNNEEIYPSIQNISLESIGLVNEVVAVEPVISDDVDGGVEYEAVVRNIEDIKVTDSVRQDLTKTIYRATDYFITVEEGTTAKLTANFSIRVSKPQVRGGEREVVSGNRPPRNNNSYYNQAIENVDYKINSSGYCLYEESTGDKKQYNGEELPPGKYALNLYCDISMLGAQVNGIPLNSSFYTVEMALTEIKLDPPMYEDVPTSADSWKPTFDIWIKNIWQTEKLDTETDQQYAERVWLPILGTDGKEASVTFSSGWLSSSSDWDFKIVKGGFAYDTSKEYNGVPSHWKLTLEKSDAEMEATDKYIPNMGMQAVAGDTFFFTNIDMQHQYVLFGEQRVMDWQYESLQDTKDIKPALVAKLDKIRINTLENNETQYLIDSIKTGAYIHIAERRFSNTEFDRYIQTVTYNYTDKMLADVEIVLSDKIIPVVNPVQLLQGEVETLSQAILHPNSSMIAQLRNIFDTIYLRKDGVEDVSKSPTSFKSIVKSDDFRSGIVGGTGWGVYKDVYGRTVAEFDQIKARQSFETNSFVKNETKYVGGKQISSAACIEVSRVEETETSYICYFNTKGGSLHNHFALDDIAYCQGFYSDDTPIKSYKYKVIGVGIDHIILDKNTHLGDVPDANDVIIHYGNYTDANRQYVIIRDVIGGGYDRMLAELNSIDAVGKEYYFTGRQNNESPRWFVGDKDGEYAEWKDGKMHIKGKLEVGSDVGGATVIDGGLVTAETIALGGAEVKAGVTGDGESDGDVRFWAGVPYKERKNAPFKVLQDGSVYSSKGVFEHSQLNSVEINGAFRNAFQDGRFVLNGTPIVETSMPGVQNNNNVIINNGSGWGAPSDVADALFKLPVGVEYNGFRATIINSNIKGGDATYAIKSEGLDSDYSIYNNGVTSKTIRIKPREGVELLGYGYGGVFKGWIVLNRFWLSGRKEGFVQKVLFSGMVDTDGTFVNYRTFNSSKLTITRDDEKALIRINFENPFDEEYMVFTTGWGDNYASLWGRDENGFTVMSRNANGLVPQGVGFSFMVVTLENRYDPFKEYNKNWT